MFRNLPTLARKIVLATGSIAIVVVTLIAVSAMPGAKPHSAAVTTTSVSPTAVAIAPAAVHRSGTTTTTLAVTTTLADAARRSQSDRRTASSTRGESNTTTSVATTTQAGPAEPAQAAPTPSRSKVWPPITNCIEYTGTNLAAFVTAAERTYPKTECLSSSGESLTTSAEATLDEPAVLNFEGATVAGTSALTDAMVNVTAAGGSITDVTLNEGAGSGNGIDCHAACRITQSTVEGMRGDGIFVSAAPGSVIGGDTPASGVSTVGNTDAGLEVNHTVGVTLGYVTSTLDNHYGVDFQTVSGSASMPCSAESITTTDVGAASSEWGLSSNISGSGLELIGSGTTSGTGCRFQTVTANGQGGYGLALGSSSYNSFSAVYASGESHGDNNPGINLDNGSAHNTISWATVDNETVGIEIGDSGVKGGAGGAGNDDNAFGTLTFGDDTYGAIAVIGGSANTFFMVTGVGVGNAGGGFYEGLIQFRTNPSTGSPDTGNVVRSAGFSGAAGEGKYDVAPYVVYADAGTSGNSVTLRGVSASTYKVAPCSQTPGSNSFAGC
jgi:hypothetical protein